MARNDDSLEKSERSAGRIRLMIAVVGGALTLLAAGLGLMHWATNHARSTTDIEARRNSGAHLNLLESELQKFRLLPRVLTQFPDVRSALADDNVAVPDRLNHELEQLAERTNAAVIYVLDSRGKTIAASNWRTSASFVGQNYGFRPYYHGAMRHGEAELFALGTVSGRPGIYLARRVGTGQHPLGVIVVKVEFDPIERKWADSNAISLVTDKAGIVIMSSNPAWQFRSISPVSAAERARLRASRRYGERSLAPLAVQQSGGDMLIRSDGRSVAYRQVSSLVSLAGTRFHLLQPLAPGRDSANATARVLFLVLFILVGAIIVALLRLVERQTMRQAAHQALIGEVAARTRELSEANAELRRGAERQSETDRKYRAAREELAQASRLGSIGQITAGVAHEINQPVAAIRTFADNSLRYLDRGEPEKARGNINTIVDLTARVGAITNELRNFARRKPAALGPITLQSAIDGTLLLVGDRLRAQGVAIEIELADRDVAVHADRVRLEQILVNLLQNAAEAMQETADPRIVIRAEGDNPVRVDVYDNGPGVPEALAPELFTPFVTGRSDGLGLGLAISSTIMSEFGGTLTLVPSPLGGAGFRLELKRA